jgi:hypothetical protein
MQPRDGTLAKIQFLRQAVGGAGLIEILGYIHFK